MLIWSYDADRIVVLWCDTDTMLYHIAILWYCIILRYYILWKWRETDTDIDMIINLCYIDNTIHDIYIILSWYWYDDETIFMWYRNDMGILRTTKIDNDIEKIYTTI